MNDQVRVSRISRVEAEQFDYQAEADKTCSPHWNPENIDLDAFVRTLRQFIDLCGVLNVYYKLLLRGKTPDQFNCQPEAARTALPRTAAQSRSAKSI
jgi:hypothetical protein